MKKFLWVMVTAIVVALGISPFAFAAATTQVDKLLDKLVEKRILTVDEAAQLKGEIAYDEKEIRATNMKSDLPQWVQDMKLSGDFRLRFDHSRDKTTAINSAKNVNRGRIRMRLGLETKINDKVKVGIGIATDGGSNNARSNNQSFNTFFAKAYPVLNYAYAQYNPNDNWQFTGGQMLNPIWEPFEFLWDADITPQGGTIQFNKKLNDSTKVFLTGTAFQLADISTNEADPFLGVIQGGLEGNLREKFN